MQKVVGSNPISRSLKGLHLQARRKWLFAGSSSSFEPMTSCGGDAEGHEFDSLASPGPVRSRALAGAGPTDLEDNRLGREREPGNAPPGSSGRSSSSIAGADGDPGGASSSRASGSGTSPPSSGLMARQPDQAVLGEAL